jgi:hypothetical protein
MDRGRLAPMKTLPTALALLWLAAPGVMALLPAVTHAAQPIIQMPPPPTNADEGSALSSAPDSYQVGGHGPCIGDGTGYVRARIRGALNIDLDWKDAQLQCGGDARPDGSGLRLSFAGLGPGGKPLRMVFGVRSAREGRAGKELPTNLTVLLDGGRVFATLGDDKCTTDQLSQRPLAVKTGPGSGARRAWRIEARGFCVEPANDVAGHGRIVVSRFDFAGRIEFSDHR